MLNIRQCLYFVVMVAGFAVSTFAASVTVAWNPNPDPSVTGYNLYYWITNGASAMQEVSAGAATSVTISSLQTGTTYGFAATTINTAGLESPLSAAIYYTVPNSVTVANPTNLPPTLNAIKNMTVTENSALRTVRLAGITSGSSSEKQTLTVTAVSSFPGLIPNPTVHYASPGKTGTLTFKPVVNAVGTATITVTVNDGAAASNVVTQSFTIMVKPKGPLSGGSPPWGSAQTTKAVAANSKNAVVLPASVAKPAAILAVVPAAAGQFTLTVTGVDGQSCAVQASTDLVNWTVLQTNTAPFIFTDTDAAKFNQRFYRAVNLP